MKIDSSWQTGNGINQVHHVAPSGQRGCETRSCPLVKKLEGRRGGVTGQYSAVDRHILLTLHIVLSMFRNKKIVHATNSKV